ncbi:hypothetical protein [Microcoleus sp. D3_18a_C4]|uniref:hypothetical protein n=1 Tax=unclassified Microcoleus TaxID=2642155 RepID=UPI002FCE8CE2
MLIEWLSIKSVSRFSMVGAVAIALVLSSPNLAKAESRDRAVDRLTDFLWEHLSYAISRNTQRKSMRE